MKYKLERIKPGEYLGVVNDYDVKTSGTTNRTYLNLYLNIDAEGKEIDVHTAYCLDIGRNANIVRLMKEIGGLGKDGNANFDKLLEPYFWVNLTYDKYGMLAVDSMKMAHEDELEESEDSIEDEFEVEE